MWPVSKRKDDFDMEDRFERFTFSIFEIEKCWHKLTGDEMASYGLKGPHSLYLITLAKYEEGISATKLCEICGKDKADVSRMMGIMIEKNLVVKEGNYRNNYGGVYKLTDAGKEAAKKVKNKVLVAVDAASKNLSEENRVILYDALSLISNNLKVLVRDGIPDSPSGVS